jgi:D-lyxose ketol-isomerase
MDRFSDVTLRLDGVVRIVAAGSRIRLKPGESISIQPLLYHDFEIEAGTGAVLIGEVSECNDDNTDNRFEQPIGRFPVIEEDEAPYRLLCNEYPEAKT